MAKQHNNFLTAIDVGSAKTCALMAELAEGGLRYRGHGLAESSGSRKGVIVDLDKAVAAIQKAVEACEDVAGAPVEHAIVGIGGAHVRGVNSHGGISLGTRPHEIGRDEIKQAVERARAIPLPADREVLHLLPQEFILDDQAGVHDPLGMMAARLEVRVHLVTVAASAAQNVITAVNRAGVHVDDTVFEPLGAADSVLRADERELGVCLADIGAGSTELIVFVQGAVAYTGVIPVGGDHFTSDLSVGMCTALAEAEKIKKVYGNAIVTLIPEGNEVEVPRWATALRACCRNGSWRKFSSRGRANYLRCCAKLCGRAACSTRAWRALCSAEEVRGCREFSTCRNRCCGGRCGCRGLLH